VTAVTFKDGSTEAEIAHLRALGLQELRARWRSVFSRKAPDHLSRHLLFRIIAYRIQEDRFGGLKPETRRLLDQLGAATESGAAGKVIGALRQREALRPGTVLVREWKGKRQHVMVTAGGFSWNGREFGSLSEVASAMTGSRWSGPRFFGLRHHARSKT
jgi:Protein of unknown function (DUF2924)